MTLITYWTGNLRKILEKLYRMKYVELILKEDQVSVSVFICIRMNIIGEQFLIFFYFLTVLIFPYARWNSWDFTDSGRREEYIKYMNQMLEKCVASIKAPATQFVILADSEGFSFRHMSHMKG